MWQKKSKKSKKSTLHFVEYLVDSKFVRSKKPRAKHIKKGGKKMFSVFDEDAMVLCVMSEIFGNDSQSEDDDNE